MSIEPITRKERILAGEDVKPLRRDEYFIKNATPGGSGGSSLPTYTSSDIGKVLMVGEGTETVQTVVVPEQTVTVSGESPIAELTGVDTSFFATLNDGDVVPIVVNGTTYNLTGHSEAGVFVLAPDGGSGVRIMYFPIETQGIPAGTYLVASESGTYTVSVTVSALKVEPKWESPQGGGTESEYPALNEGRAYQLPVIGAREEKIEWSYITPMNSGTQQTPISRFGASYYTGIVFTSINSATKSEVRTAITNGTPFFPNATSIPVFLVLYSSSGVVEMVVKISGVSGSLLYDKDPSDLTGLVYGSAIGLNIISAE